MIQRTIRTMNTIFLINPTTRQATKEAYETYKEHREIEYPHLKGCEYVDSVICYDQIGDVWYAEELANADGMYFTLVREPHHTDEDITKVKNYLYRERDVVKIRIASVREIIDFNVQNQA